MINFIIGVAANMLNTLMIISKAFLKFKIKSTSLTLFASLFAVFRLSSSRNEGKMVVNKIR